MKHVSSVVALILTVCSYAAADTLVPASVTCTGEFNSDYPCSALIDGITNDLTAGPAGGSVHSYWLGRETGAPPADPPWASFSNETFTVDLGYVDLVTGFDIFNTHNGAADDRGTLAFTIWLSPTPVVPDTTSSSFGTDVLDSSLCWSSCFVNPNPDQPFTLTTPTYAQYVTFRATSVNYNGSAGLSEFQVEGTTPEPATFLLAGIALVALSAIRRRNSNSAGQPHSLAARTSVVKYQLMSDPDSTEQKPEDFQIPLPPASFGFLVLSLRTQAEIQLGLVHFGEEEPPQPDFRMARHSIDLMAVLLEKTKGNLTLDEQRLLENSLTELRFRFVQVSDEAGKAAAPKA
jgi:hypothetical protein